MTTDETNSKTSTPPAQDRPPFRRFYAMPPWFKEEVEKVPRSPDLRDRLTEWFRQQRLDCERGEAAERLRQEEPKRLGEDE